MTTPADQRLLELLDKWLNSLELHLKYSSLDEDSYWKIQPWLEHQRPSRWIIDLAKQKALTLQVQVKERIKMGDAKFSENLELMTFLANLVGSQHIERFIPLAEPGNEQPLALASPPKIDHVELPLSSAVTGTREMPKFVAKVKPTTKPAVKMAVKAAEVSPVASHDQVINDAARLVQWGRKWYELAEVISRMADRPTLPEIRLILKENKAAIEKLART